MLDLVFMCRWSWNMVLCVGPVACKGIVVDKFDSMDNVDDSNCSWWLDLKDSEFISGDEDWLGLNFEAGEVEMALVWLDEVVNGGEELVIDKEFGGASFDFLVDVTEVVVDVEIEGIDFDVCKTKKEWINMI